MTSEQFFLLAAAVWLSTHSSKRAGMLLGAFCLAMAALSYYRHMGMP